MFEHLDPNDESNPTVERCFAPEQLRRALALLQARLTLLSRRPDVAAPVTDEIRRMIWLCSMLGIAPADGRIGADDPHVVATDDETEEPPHSPPFSDL